MSTQLVMIEFGRGPISVMQGISLLRRRNLEIGDPFIPQIPVDANSLETAWKANRKVASSSDAMRL